jgi:hypothetical protein
MVEGSEGYERLAAAVRDLMKKVKTAEGGIALEQIESQARIAVAAARVCEVGGVLTPIRFIGSHIARWFEYEKPSSEDLMKVEEGFRALKADISKILQERCGCRWK